MLRKLWIQLRSSLWFVPALLVVTAIITAVSLVQLDLIYADELVGQSWEPLLNAGAEGARGMLTAIASSMITVAGVAFSVTIVTLSLASTQYTPRILRNFMRDRANQFVLGTFVAIFTYCLIVLRTIRGGAEKDGGGFVPLLAVAFGMLLAILSIGCLIFFIHHVATSIQASTILKTIADETAGAIAKVFPHQLGEREQPATTGEAGESMDWRPISSEQSGYLQHINAGALSDLAKKHDALLRLERIPGDFVAAGTALASANRELDESAARTLRGLFVVGEFRTVGQDTAFGLRQIVDIAMKALSPSVNDTSTAVSCLHYLAVLLSSLATRQLVPEFLLNDGKLRAIVNVPSFEEFTAKAFDEIRLSAKGNVTIMIEMLCALQAVAKATTLDARKRPLLEQAHVIAIDAERTVPAPYDRARINDALASLRSSLGASDADLPALSSAAPWVARDAESPPVHTTSR